MDIDWKHLLFGFDGRINRAKYWLVAAIVFAVAIVSAMIGIALFPGWFGLILFVPALLLILYIGVAVAVKRLHDRNKSGWWLLLFYLVPGVLQGLAGDDFSGSSLILNLIGTAISIWAIVELGILRGTAGPNDYGPDPLEGKT